MQEGGGGGGEVNKQYDQKQLNKILYSIVPRAFFMLKQQLWLQEGKNDVAPTASLSGFSSAKDKNRYINCTAAPASKDYAAHD
jgi:hypothetical protein